MRVKLEIQEQYKEMEIHVCYHQKDEQVEQTMRQISELLEERIQVSDGRDIHLLTLGEIIRCYTEGQKVLVQTPGGVFQSGLKLYELEEKLLPGDFVRISRSELVNIHCIRQLDMNLIGTIRVILSDGTETYTSRRCIPMLKEALGLKVQKGGYHEEK